MKFEKKTLILLFATIIILFLFAEIVFRFYYYSTDKIIAMDEEEKCLRSIYLKTSDLDNPFRFENNFFTTHKQSEVEYSNITGITIKNKIRNNENLTLELKNGEYVNIFEYYINTNSQHMRAIKDFDYKKNRDTIRIALFGDSYTWGDEAPQKYTYASILERLIPNSEVLNFGIKGIGVDTMYLRWKYEALNFNPDIIIVTIFTDDIRRMQPCIHKPKLKIQNNQVNITNMPPPSHKDIFENYKKPFFESYFIKHLIYNLKYLGDVTKKQYNYGFEILPYILEDMKSDDAFLLVAIINAKDGKYQEHEEESVKKLKNLLESKKIAYIDMVELFESQGYDADDSRLHFGHFTALGNALFANGLKNKLEDEKAIPNDKDYIINIQTDDVFIGEYPFFLTNLIIQNKENPEDIKTIPKLDYKRSSKVHVLN